MSGKDTLGQVVGWVISVGLLLPCGCSSSSSSGPASGDGGDAAASDASEQLDAVSQSCAIDANIIAPVDAAANPSTARCQACLADPQSLVPSALGGGTCLGAFTSCNTDCICKTAVVTVAQCISSGSGTATSCATAQLTNATVGMDQTFLSLVACQSTVCRVACSGAPSDAGSGEAGDSSATDGADTLDSATAADGAETDGAATDGAAADASGD